MCYFCSIPGRSVGGRKETFPLPRPIDQWLTWCCVSSLKQIYQDTQALVGVYWPLEVGESIHPERARARAPAAALLRRIRPMPPKRRPVAVGQVLERFGFEIDTCFRQTIDMAPDEVQARCKEIMSNVTKTTLLSRLSIISSFCWLCCCLNKQAESPLSMTC